MSAKPIDERAIELERRHEQFCRDQRKAGICWSKIPDFQDWIMSLLITTEAALALRTQQLHEHTETIAKWQGLYQTLLDDAVDMRKQLADAIAQRDELKGWLIERRDMGRPMWLTVADEVFDWTAESTIALRMTRREDADKLAQIFLDEDIAITEHAWEPPLSRAHPDKKGENQ